MQAETHLIGGPYDGQVYVFRGDTMSVFKAPPGRSTPARQGSYRKFPGVPTHAIWQGWLP